MGQGVVAECCPAKDENHGRQHSTPLGGGTEENSWNKRSKHLQNVSRGASTRIEDRD
jgi:hypothetical protein